MLNHKVATIKRVRFMEEKSTPVNEGKQLTMVAENYLSAPCMKALTSLFNSLNDWSWIYIMCPAP